MKRLNRQNNKASKSPLFMALLLGLSVINITPQAEAATRKSPGKTPTARAAALVSGGKIDEATKALTEAKAGEKKTAEYHYLMGVCASRKKEYRKARKHLRIAIRLGKGSKISQNANREIMKVPASLIKPRTGVATRLLASLFGLSRDRGTGAPIPTVIDFYASWCTPCKKLEQDLSSISKQYGDRLRIMRVDVDDPKNEKMIDQYEISPIPTVIFLNTDGEVVDYSIGYSGQSSINRGIKKILTAPQS